MLITLFPLVIAMMAFCPPDETPPTGVSEPGQRTTLRLNPMQSGQLARWIGDYGDDGDEEHPIPSGGPWLGIQFGPVPKALAAHLKADSGMVILNIARNSPADKAGLKQYDVLLRINKYQVQDDIQGVMDHIKDLNVGDTATLRVIRGGQEQNVSLKLGARPKELDKIDYKYETAPEMAGSQTETVTPQFFQLDKAGKLSAPDQAGAKRFQQLMPRLQNPNGQWQFMIPQGGGGASVVIRQTENGETLEIRRDNDGEIKVSRTDKDGSTTKQSYKNPDALRDGDAEAYKVYKQQPEAGAKAWRIGPNGNGPGFQFEFDGKDFEKQMRDLEKRLRTELTPERLLQGRALGRAFGGAPGTTFEKQSDGSIKVRTRDGGDELVETFKSADQLKQQRPDLFKRYAKVQASREKQARDSGRREGGTDGDGDDDEDDNDD